MIDDETSSTSPLNTIQGDTLIDPAEYRPCQECGELVRLVANQCRFCGTVLAGSPGLPELIARVSSVLQKTTAAKTTQRLVAAVNTLSQKWRFRTKLTFFLTIGLTALTILFLSAALLMPSDTYPGGFFFHQRREENALRICIWASAIFFSLGLNLYWGWQDKIPATMDDRSTPENSFKAFIQSMRRGRWNYAYSFLLPADKNDTPRARVKLAKAYIRGGIFTIDNIKKFQHYWQPMLRSDWVVARRASVHDWQIHQISKEYAVGTCRYILSVTPDALFTHSIAAGLLTGLGLGLLWNIFLYIVGAMLLYGLFLAVIPWLIFHFVMKNKFVITITKHMRKVDGEWLMICGDIQSGAEMLPKLYANDFERLEQGLLPPGYTFINDAAKPTEVEASAATAPAPDTLAEPTPVSPPPAAFVGRLATILQQARTRATQIISPHTEAARYGRKIRGLTIGLFVATPLPILLIPIAPYLFSGRYAEVGEKIALVLAIFGSGISAILLGVAVYDDWRVPPAAARTNPLAGFQAWFRAMQTGRWQYAFACLLPAQPGEIARPEIKSPDIKGGSFPVQNASELQAYWRPLLHAYFIANRCIRKVTTRVEKLGANDALVHCTYRMPGDGFALTFFFLFPVSWMALPLLGLIFPGHEVAFVKYLRRVDGLWYVVTPDMQTGIDAVAKHYVGDFDRLERGEMPSGFSPDDEGARIVN